MTDPLVLILAVGVSSTIAVIALRDLYLNFRAKDPAVWRGIAHSRARAAALAGATTSLLLLDISAPVALGIWVFSTLFVLFPSNQWLTRPDGRAKKAKGATAEPTSESAGASAGGADS